MERELRVRIVLQRPPSGVAFGVQRGHGAAYATVQTQRSDGRDLQFEFSVALKAENKRTTPDFGGPFVQGPPDARFIYIDIGRHAGQADSIWSRRLKIPLSGITWDAIDRGARDPQTMLETRVPGTGRDGGPNCAAVKPFDGWKVTL
ncbi:MAG: DUF5990 family protein [Vicinamibacteraceae bacterium]